MTRIDLDHNATTPLEPEVAEAMAAALRELPGNPSSLHHEGRRARRAVEDARASVAGLIGARPEEITFTSGGTEANNLALAGTLRRCPAPLVVSSVEHASVMAVADAVERAGGEVRRVDPSPAGRVSPEAVANAVDGPVLISVMLANNETGVVQPVAEIAARARACGAIVHTDAVQAAGKIAVDVGALGVDLLSLSAHKMGGPKGVGALWARPGAEPFPLLHGGGQESGRRAGTENLPGIIGLGVAARLARAERLSRAEELARHRDRFERAILDRVPGAVALGGETPRVPNTTCLAFPGLEGVALVQLLDLKGIAASTGAACESGSDDYSHVLRAMRVPERVARGAVRFSFGAHTTGEEVERAIGLVAETLADLREL